MRKTVLALAAAGSIFAMTAAGAAAIDFGDTASDTHVVQTSNNLTVSAAMCSTASVAYVYNGSDELTGVTLTSADTDCVGLQATASLGGSELGHATFSAGGVATITFTAVDFSGADKTIAILVDEVPA